MTDSVADKICFKCHKRKLLTEFYKHPRMLDGYVNKCKECNKLDVQKNYRKNIDYYKEYDQDRNSRVKRKEEAAEKQRKHRASNPEKYKARTATNNAIRDGKLIKKPCKYCNSTERLQAHHYDYNKPLDVIWVCFKCHRQKEHNQFDYLD